VGADELELKFLGFAEKQNLDFISIKNDKI